MLLEWADGLLSKMLGDGWSGVEWMDGYPLDCYDYLSTCGANKSGNSTPHTYSMLHVDSHFEKYMMQKEKHSYSIALLFSYL